MPPRISGCRLSAVQALPMRRRTIPRACREAVMDQDRSPVNILVVDDEPMLLDSLTVFLESNGYRIRTARDGLAALDELVRWQPDLVLLDLMLPGLDGME